MEKSNVSELGTNQTQATNDVSLLPYSAPELHVYNQAKITMGGVNAIPLKGDYVGGVSTSYKGS